EARRRGARCGGGTHREFRRVARRACRGGRDYALAKRYGERQRRETRIAAAVGRYVSRADEALAFAVPGGIACCVGEELEMQRRVRIAVDGARYRGGSRRDGH